MMIILAISSEAVLYTDDPSLVAWYPCNDTAGGLKDYSGNGFDMTQWAGGGTYAYRKKAIGNWSDYGIVVNGGTFYNEAGGLMSQIDDYTTGLTVLILFNATGDEVETVSWEVDGGDGQRVYLRGSHASSYHWFYEAFNRLQLDLSGEDTDWDMNQHGCVAYQINDDNASYYKNGTFNEHATWTGAVTDPTSTKITFGGRAFDYGVRGFIGTYSGMAIFNRTLSGIEIKEFCTQGLTPALPPADTLNMSNSSILNNTQYGYNSLDINFTIDASNNFTCSLQINGTLNDTANQSAGQDVTINFNKVFAEGDYYHNATCTDGITTETSSINYFHIDTINPVISWNNPPDTNDTIVRDTLLTDIDISDDNLYSYSFNATYENGTNVFNVTNTSLTGLSTFKLNYLLNFTGYTGNITSRLGLCDGHTGEDVFFNGEVTADEILYDNGEIKIYLKSKTDTADLSTTKKGDRYEFSFTTFSPQTLLVVVVESIYYIDILDGLTDYEGHLVTSDKWIDFAGIGTTTTKRVDANKVEVSISSAIPITKWNFNSIGQLNCIFEEARFMADASPPQINLSLPSNRSVDTDGDITFRFYLSETSSCDLWVNGSVNGTNVSNTAGLNYFNGFNAQNGTSWYYQINCTDGLDNNGTSFLYVFDVLIPATDLKYGFFDTDATCVLDQELGYVIGYFFIIVLILVLFFVNLLLIKIPIISILLGIGEIIVTLNFYPCTWILGTIFTLFGIIMVFYEIILLYRNFTSL